MPVMRGRTRAASGSSEVPQRMLPPNIPCAGRRFHASFSPCRRDRDTAFSAKGLMTSRDARSPSLRKRRPADVYPKISVMDEADVARILTQILSSSPSSVHSLSSEEDDGPSDPERGADRHGKRTPP